MTKEQIIERIIKNFVPYEPFSISISKWPSLEVSRKTKRHISDIFLDWAEEVGYQGRFSYTAGNNTFFIEDKDTCEDFKLSYNLGVFDE